MRDIYLAHGAPYLRHDLLHSVLMDMDFVKDYKGYLNFFLYNYCLLPTKQTHIKKAVVLKHYFFFLLFCVIYCIMLNLALIIYKLKLHCCAPVLGTVQISSTRILGHYIFCVVSSAVAAAF